MKVEKSIAFDPLHSHNSSGYCHISPTKSPNPQGLRSSYQFSTRLNPLPQLGALTGSFFCPVALLKQP